MLSGSMEPGLQRGDILFFGLKQGGCRACVSAGHTGPTRQVQAMFGRPGRQPQDSSCLLLSLTFIWELRFLTLFGEPCWTEQAIFLPTDRGAAHFEVQARRCCCLSDRGAGAAGNLARTNRAASTVNCLLKDIPIVHRLLNVHEKPAWNLCVLDLAFRNT